MNLIPVGIEGRSFSEDAVLETQRLSVIYESRERRTVAVDAVELAVRPGEVLALVGESGSGKSTVGLGLLGLLPDGARREGTVRLGGRAISDLSGRELADIRGNEISMVFQEPMTSLNPVMPVGRQIEEVIRRHHRASRREASVRAEELFREVGIPEPRLRLKNYPHQLSGGMRQRVMIAMAIACNPKVIIADEPTTALDVTVQATILRLLQELGRRHGTAILLITHDLGVVADVADRAAVMYAGRIVEIGDTDDVLSDPRHPYTRALLAATPHRVSGGERRPLSEIPGVVPALDSPAASCAFLDRCPFATSVCRDRRPEHEPAAERWVACFHPVQKGNSSDGSR